MNSTAPPTPELLADLIPMVSLRPEARRDLTRNTAFVDLRAGDFLFRIGEIARQALYLLEGQVELRDAGGAVVARVVAQSPQARHRLSDRSPHKLDGYCLTDVRCLAVDSRLLDVMLTWEQTDALQVGEVGAQPASDGDDWMTRLLHTRAFQMVPPSNLQAIFLRMERLDATPGQVIVGQGQAGDYFYVIIGGRCIVTREQPGRKTVRLAELETGACFGEEALISDQPRNATVTMLTRGSLMRLSKDDFRTLLNEPLTQRVSRADAVRMAARNDAVLLDVRLPSEYQAGSLAGAINVPLYMLRLRLSQLPLGRPVICMCDTGRRSSVAAFVLIQKGYQALLLTPGLDAAG